MALQPLDGYQVERSGSHAVALDTVLDDDLRHEGYAREVVHAVQNARKEAGFDVADRISLRLGGDAELIEAVRAHEEYLTGETLATSLDLKMPSHETDPESRATATVDGRELRIGVVRA